MIYMEKVLFSRSTWHQRQVLRGIIVQPNSVYGRTGLFRHHTIRHMPVGHAKAKREAKWAHPGYDLKQNSCRTSVVLLLAVKHQ